MGEITTDMFIYREDRVNDRGRLAPPLKVKRLIGGLGWVCRLFRHWSVKSPGQFEPHFVPRQLKEAVAVEANSLAARQMADAASAVAKTAREAAIASAPPTSSDKLQAAARNADAAANKADKTVAEAEQRKDDSDRNLLSIVHATANMVDAATAAAKKAIAATRSATTMANMGDFDGAKAQAEQAEEAACNAEQEASKAEEQYAIARKNAGCTDEIYYLLSEFGNEAMDRFQQSLRAYADSLAAESRHLSPNGTATCPLAAEGNPWRPLGEELGGACLNVLKNPDRPEWPKTTWRCKVDPERRFGGDRHGEVHGPAPLPPLGLSIDNGLVLLLYDMDRGYFRNAIKRLGLPNLDFTWIVLGTLPRFRPMLEAIPEACSDRLVGIVNLEQIRELDVHISRGYSWERTVEELLAEFRQNPELSALHERCKHLVIQIGFEGALYLTRSNGTTTGTLYFDPCHLEGEFWDVTKNGYIPGLAECPLTAIAVQLARTPDDPAKALRRGIHRGLTAARWMLQVGQREQGEYFARDTDYLATCIFSDDKEHETKFGDCDISTLDPNSFGSWQIATAKRALMPDLAMHVAKNGRSAIKSLPHLRLGKLDSVDRSEIQGLRILMTLFREYLGQTDAKTPLSVAVFGEPGNGKSFAVKQIVEEQFWDDCEFIEVNLSQLEFNAGLSAPMHKVRGAVFRRKTPVVLWDEFDCDEWKWLKAFLAPMEDGVFIENQTPHPLGKCIFVFAGGVSHSFEKFENLRMVKSEAGSTHNFEEFQRRKGPDFISRLSHVFNVMGPNQRADVMDLNRPDPQDTCWPLRRALLLRSLLNCGEDEKLNIDEGLLRALLLGPRYTYGKRSMKKLVETLRSRAGRGRICRSMLPPPETLKLYVEVTDFMRQVGDKCR